LIWIAFKIKTYKTSFLAINVRFKKWLFGCIICAVVGEILCLYMEIGDEEPIGLQGSYYVFLTCFSGDGYIKEGLPGYTCSLSWLLLDLDFR
jgi:hypothetical protein